MSPARIANYHARYSIRWVAVNRKLGGGNEWGARGSARGVQGAGKMTQTLVGGW